MSARILVVDDILPNVKLLAAKLTGEYYDVLTATSGEEALEICEKELPDLILLDIMMPGMDGFEVCERVKADPKTAHIPIVMVTALTDATDRVRGLEAGADDFLSKPVNDTALMARVRSLVRLKMTVDEWRIRENTANQFGVFSTSTVEMTESGENARILVVEDKSFESEKFVESLKKDNDIIMSVSNGQQAMEQGNQEAYDLITISLNLATEDGLRLCSQIRSNERTRSVPILMVAEEEDMPKIARGLEIGAQDYILRPVDRNELLARARTQIRRKRYQDRLRSNYEASLSMALTDSLTGLFNRRYLMVHLAKTLASYKENKKSIGVLMLDIDHFKKINDTYGHAAGDEVLKVFAERIAKSLRSFDLVARMGGEEFVAILPDISEKVATQVTERLRHSIADKPIPVSGPEGAINVTVSIGGMLVNTEGITVEDALDSADKSLYTAKESGRDCCVFANIGLLEKVEKLPERKLEEDSEGTDSGASGKQQAYTGAPMPGMQMPQHGSEVPSTAPSQPVSQPQPQPQVTQEVGAPYDPFATPSTPRATPDVTQTNEVTPPEPSLSASVPPPAPESQVQSLTQQAPVPQPQSSQTQSVPQPVQQNQQATLGHQNQAQQQSVATPQQHPVQQPEALQQAPQRTASLGEPNYDDAILAGYGGKDDVGAPPEPDIEIPE